MKKRNQIILQLPIHELRAKYYQPRCEERIMRRNDNRQKMKKINKYTHILRIFPPVISSIFACVIQSASASSITVTARIVESTCAIQVTSNTSGTVDLGDWTYSEMANMYQLSPVSGSGVGTGTAGATVSLDPACPTIGLSGLTMEFSGPPGSTMSDALAQSMRWDNSSSQHPTFALTSSDGLSAFPVWVDVMGDSSSKGSKYLICRPTTSSYSSQNNYKWVYSRAAGWLFVDNGVVFNSGVISGSNWIALAGADSGYSTQVVDNTGGVSQYPVTRNTRKLSERPVHACVLGSSIDTSFNIVGMRPTTERAVSVSYKLRFTGPRSIPLNGWPSPPPSPGTQYSGTIMLKMTYL